MRQETELSELIDFILNGFLHVTLLFSFLTVLYYFIISPLTLKLLHNEIGDIIDNIFNNQFPKPITININNNLSKELSNIKNKLEHFTNEYALAPTDNDKQYLLSNLSNFNNKINSEKKILNNTYNYYINPNLLNNLIETYSTPNNILLTNNQSIMYHTLFISVCLFIITIILSVSFKLRYNDHVNISHILCENLLIFSIIGYIEYWFFTTYAFKYIPLLPSKLSTLLNENIIKELNTPYMYTNSTAPFLELPIPIIFS
jgi:hypothetical protein